MIEPYEPLYEMSGVSLYSLDKRPGAKPELFKVFNNEELVKKFAKTRYWKELDFDPKEFKFYFTDSNQDYFVYRD